MATRLFLHAAANALSGTFPTAEQSTTFTAKYVATNGNTLRTMNSLTGVSQTTLIISTSSSATYEAFWGHFCSPALSGTQTIGASAQELTLNIARDVSSTAASATAIGMNLYVWRPSTGAKVGTIFDGTMNPIDLAAGITQRTFNATISAATSVIALNGDVLIVEAWQKLKPASAINRALTMYYDGGVVSTTQSASSSQHAAFLNFATDTLVFQSPPASASFAQTLGAVTLAGVGSSPRNGTFNNSLAAATLAGVGAVPLAGSFSNTLATVSLSASMLVGVALGSFSNTLAAAALAGVGDSPRNGAFSNTLGAASLSGVGSAPVIGAFSVGASAVTLGGEGTVQELAAAEGTFNNTLQRAVLSATGQVRSAGQRETPPTSAGHGQAKTGKRKKFTVPSVEQVPYVDRMFDDLKREPMPQVVETPTLVPRSTLIADSLVKMAPTLPPLPAPLPKVEVIEPDDDSDMIMIAMLL